MPQSKEATDMVEHFINLFPNMDAGFVSDVVLSEEVNGDKNLIHKQLVSMGGIPVDGEGLEIGDDEQESIEAVQNFIVDCNEHLAELIGGLSRPESFTKEDEIISQVQEDIAEAESMLKNTKLHPISKDGLDSLIREGTEVLACFGGMTENGDLGASTKLDSTQVQMRTGADPMELERLREMLKKEQKDKKILEKQVDDLITERDAAKTAAAGAEKIAAAQAVVSPIMVPKQTDSDELKQLKKSQEEAARTIALLKEENLKVMTAFKTLTTSTRRLIVRQRESHTEIREAISEEKARMQADFAECAQHIGKLKQTEMMERMYKKMEKMYREEVQLRKSYYNTIQELRGNIRVFCRVRPLIGIEKDKGTTDTCIDYVKDDNEVVIVKGERGSKKFTFNKIFGPGCTQKDIFTDTLPLIDSVVDGYNVCIFAYGQTGSGKSYTMEGPSQDDVTDPEKYKELRGVNRRAVDRMYDIINERKDAETTVVYVSVLEIYCERVRDLLAPKKKKEDKDDYKVRSGLHPVGDYEVPGNYVEGLVQVKVSSSDEITNLLDEAKSSRKEGTTDMNTHSSRSHMILSLVACTRNNATGAQSFGKLNLIDLAGSERLAKTNATGQTAEEAKNINLSLTSLGKVIADLQSGAKHINYRDSKLTHLLQDSLGGQSKVLMFANCSPASFNSSETKSTLEMASRAMKCSLGTASKNKVASKK
eukprot:TRINITY_DN3511_c0_g5_i1.p1 TRINITY_DN3511_c0_g5~~TRINITY_DN3511_c0_g5_i1.p1  ORF type:complete len:706 (+),score=157.57 TRINITY_DN3511_c0_g5_i1:45-2162(+)